MPEETKVIETPIPEETKPQEPTKKEEDLVTRVSQVKQETPKKEEVTEGSFNINDLDAEIEKVSDPALKEQMVGLKKSLLKGENQKYQEIATLRKQYEQKMADVSTWTPERVRAEMNKPDFVKAAQDVIQSQNPSGSGLTDDQWSGMSDAEKAEIKQLKDKINLLERSTWEASKIQQDNTLKNKYANYASDIVDTTTQGLMSGKIQATREDLWKVIDYENAVRRAYELGKQDKLTENTEKVGGMTFDTTGRTVTAPTGVERQKGESVTSFMRRSYQEHTKKK